MNIDCICCQKPNSTNLIYQSKLWRIELAPDQTYLGRCYITLQRHCGSIADLERQEWDEFINIVRELEKSLKVSFNATKFDWTVLMNDAYKNIPPNPHVHWHFRPRYDHEVLIKGTVFEDPNFAHHYKRGTNHLVSTKVKASILNQISSNFNLN